MQVEEVAGSWPDRSHTREAMTFEIANHDDILAIIDRVHAGTAFTPDDASALTLGLKLFSGVLLKHRRDPMFADIQPALRVFIGNLKSRVAASSSSI